MQRAGAAACDRRRDIASAQAAFPGIDFSHIEPGKDLVYERHRVETVHAVQERGAKFLQWLMARCTCCSMEHPGSGCAHFIGTIADPLPYAGQQCQLFMHAVPTCYGVVPVHL